ncbi:hypothetical protein GCM10011383_27640 [Hymenobacter cavernae]|uniref:Carboxypeptidase-like regulatory domain-containing protein n=1 Tax=Hymenobacter cavernae TaxID=2044852 RepID=A0ABQ1UDN2_9BACT|nr:hypothetical protein GCM10011383_27640 [Hymenobacter cavernae]
MRIGYLYLLVLNRLLPFFPASLPRWVYLVLPLLLLASVAATAQVRVTGSVSNASDGKPVPGTTVRISRTKQGVIANAEGEFSIDVDSPSDTLVFSSVGFQTQRLPLGRTGLSQLIIQIKLVPGNVLLGEVRVEEGRADRSQINKALRNIRRPSTAPTSAVKRLPKPPPLFPVDSTAPKAPKVTIQSPVSLIYDQFSKAGKERRKLEELQAADAARLKAEQARKERERYNRNFKDNRGYE